ncbi:uncharacterized protein TRIREDRAFT_61945 [Trichoderma reesei QM6a]|uniref:Predicted protein n=2 Tax=Hypocrea jecorina TaxID=51453 RepID=G0RJJ9_HYPJQ|nr:uncharacterized protein TRIREDRAFT_61945 [Trichoderma reesei QM6a]EGR48605.1 predicted protein [Trichoderma reesei QM6a]ETS01528.1 hypothetical protein M419DRAFT_81048 [Trichoderma reesei RUT C-30]
MEAPREAAADAVPSTSTASAVVQEPQQPQRVVASHPPPPQRSGLATRERYNHQSLGASLNSLVKHARVLMVGAGGIGCELLKNLVLTGFGEIHIVDLDTIDLSNLNRQFLFRHEHIKKSKSLVAKEAAQRFNPNVKIVAHHANIKDLEFSVPWFRDFKIVFNALDNLDARRHVNKMCLAADVPLIESGTTGFNGQVQVIKKGLTACYDCTPKDTPKSFPICTIRSTPSQPIHCIVWGKSYLLNEIFGVSEDDFDHSADADNAHEIEELKKESEALKQIRESIGTPKFPKLLFDKVFNADIERLRSAPDVWKSRRAPEALKYDEVMARASQLFDSKDAILADGQKIWSLEENFVVFNDSLDRLSKRLLQMRATKDASAPEPTITFDKDDDDTLDFVASSANIRSTIFGIDLKSRFDIKQMAGNIIPAIATTNAIVAGLCVLQSFKVLKGEYGQAKEVFLTPFANARLLAPDRNREPNRDCPVCGVYYTSVIVDLNRATLRDIVEGLVKNQFGYGDKEFAVSYKVGDELRSVYDPDDRDNLGKKLTELGIKGGTFLTISDWDDELVDVTIDIQDGILDDQKESFRTVHAGRPEIPHKPQKPSAVEADGESHGQPNGKHTLDEEVVVEEPKGAKRPPPDDESPPLKRAKVASSDDDVVVVEDAGGAIVIDD